jgi:hypothetical protein
MENQKRFDLEQSLSQWRSTLEDSPAIRRSDMEELEAHLRDSIQTLQSKGLSVEDAFLIACQRLGPSQELHREYGKANQRQVWLDHALWLAVGLMLYSWICPLAYCISLLIFACFPNWNIGFPWTGLFSLVIRSLVEAAGWLFFLRLVTRYSKATTGWVRYCFRNPLLPLLGILVLNLNEGTFINWFILLTKTKLSGPSMDLDRTNSWYIWRWHISNLMYVIPLVCLVYGYLRRLGKASPEPAMAVLEPPPSSLEVLALQNKGLSNPEATFLVQRRQSKDSAGFRMDFACVRLIWMERLIWMMTAVVLFDCFVPRTQLAVHFMALQIPWWLLNNGHLLAAIGLLLQIALFLSLAAIAWRVTTRPIKVIPWFVGIFVKWPLASVLGLLCLIIGGYWCLFTCLSLLMAATSHSWQGNAVMVFLEWQRYERQFCFAVLPVLLVFWLGRQRLNLTVKDLFRLKWN